MKTIYGLHNGDKAIRYVGQTNDMQRRFKQITDLSLTQGAMIRFWASVNAGSVIMVELEKCSDELANGRERFWIQYYRDEKFPLVNMEDGGTDTKRKPSLSLLESMRCHWAKCSEYQPTPTEWAFLRELINQQKKKVRRNKPKRRKRKGQEHRSSG